MIISPSCGTGSLMRVGGCRLTNQRRRGGTTPGMRLLIAVAKLPGRAKNYIISIAGRRRI